MTDLSTIDRKDAELLLRALARRDILTALQAQHDYAGPDFMEEAGLASQLEAFTRQYPDTETLLAAVKKKLGWKKGDTPSVYFMAKRAGEEQRYKFLYHATSRAVHFSVGELMRHVWGRPGNMTIGYNSFEKYWANFAISWGWQLYLDTLMLSKELLSGTDHEVDDARADKLLEIASRIAKVGKVPIIMAQELTWPFDDSDDATVRR